MIKQFTVLINFYLKKKEIKKYCQAKIMTCLCIHIIIGFSPMNRQDQHSIKQDALLLKIKTLIFKIACHCWRVYLSYLFFKIAKILG